MSTMSEITWLSDYDEAMARAQETARPLFADFRVPG